MSGHPRQQAMGLWWPCTPLRFTHNLIPLITIKPWSHSFPWLHETLDPYTLFSITLKYVKIRRVPLTFKARNSYKSIVKQEVGEITSSLLTCLHIT